MQLGYNKALEWCVARPKTTVALSILPLLLSIVIYKFGLKQQFFPYAERNQFVVELWMPTGTSLSATERANEKIENLIKNDSRVVNYTSFIGTSAPRFYYNFAPEFPTSNYAQILINTIDDETTMSLAKELADKVERAVPEGLPQVRLMQQGQTLKSSIEVQIWGENIVFLKNIAAQIESIIKSKNGSAHVGNDFKEDY
jgi:multidrug efflux pump subunit AcrB